MNSQVSTNSSGTATDARIGAALDEFFREQRDGRRLPVDEWLAAHADLADRLKTHLELIGYFSNCEDPIAALIERGVLRATSSNGFRAEIENYRVVGVIGSGGMGVVMDARHATLNRRVALKFLLPQRIGDPLAVKRFISEARSLGRLNHPNIVTLIDVFEARGVPVLVMEYVDGTALDRRIREFANSRYSRLLPASRRSREARQYSSRLGPPLRPGDCHSH